MTVMLRMVMTLLLLGCAATVPDARAQISDRYALTDVSVGKGLFLVNVGEAEQLAGQLEVIMETQKQLANQGIKPDLIVVFLSRSVGFLTKDHMGIPFTQLATVERIQQSLSELQQLGIKLEVGEMALKSRGVSDNDVAEPLNVVGNGYISAIGYQRQGYALVPIQ